MADLWNTRDLLLRLCHNFQSKGTSPTYQTQSSAKKQCFELYKTLLKFDSNTNSVKKNFLNNGTVIDLLLAEAFRMRWHRMFDHAEKLQEIVDKLMTLPLFKGNLEFENCLKFLLFLSKWEDVTPSPLDGQWNIPNVVHKKPFIHHFRMPPLYGDSSAYSHSFCYTHYPSTLFEKVEQLEDCKDFDPAIFEQVPSIQNATFQTSNNFHRNRGFVLFGAVRRPTGSPEMVDLAIPVLMERSVCNPMENTLRGGHTFSKISPDEGFVDELIENEEPERYSDPTEIWEAVCGLKNDEPQYVSWEHRIGPSHLLRRETFLAQSGPEGLENSYKRFLQSLRLVAGPTIPSNYYAFSPHLELYQFVKDVIHLLLGVASVTFPYDQGNKRFVLRTMARLQGTTSEALGKLVEDFLDCGSIYVTLDAFSISSPLSSLHKSGYIAQCFKEGVRDFLQHYRGFILHAGDVCSKTLLSLHSCIIGVHRQLRYLKELCAGERMPSLRMMLPRGLNLISFLYEQALQEWGGSNSYLLLDLLRSSLKPYLAFLHGWIFQGFCQDSHSEYDIEINERYLSDTYGDYFWVKGYVLKESSRQKSLLDSDLREAILICGRSLNLLKLCCPKHYLFDVKLQERPQLALLLTDDELNTIKFKSEAYYNTVKNSLDRSKELRIASNKVTKRVRPTAELGSPNSAKGGRLKGEPRTSTGASDDQNSTRTEPETSTRRPRSPDFVPDENFKAMEEVLRKDMIEEYSSLEQTALKQKDLFEWKSKRYELHSKRVEFLNSERERYTTEAPSSLSVTQKRSGEVETATVVSAEPDGLSPNADLISDFTIGNINSIVLGSSESVGGRPVLSEIEISEEHVKLDVKEFEREHKDSINDGDAKCGMLGDSPGELVLELAEGVVPRGLTVENIPSVENGIPLTNKDNLVKDTLEPKKGPKYDAKPYLPYSGSFDTFSGGNIFSSLQSLQTDEDGANRVESSFNYTPLPVLIQKSLYPPIFAQIKLVNQATLDYFTEDLHLHHHFAALQKYFFFQDGEFGHALSQLVFEKISTLAPSFLSPFDLMGMLDTALLSSVSVLNDTHSLASNLSFMAEDMTTPGFESIKSFHLKYKVPWPVNLIITEANLVDYDRIFGLLMLVKQSLWVLNDAWDHLKQDDNKHKGISKLPIFRKVQLYRHEMLHFVGSIQSHLCSQLLQISWSEFQNKLQNDCQNLEDLRSAHQNYLQKSLKRSLLLPEDSEMLKNVKICFDKILKFRSFVINFPWQQSVQRDVDSFSKIVVTHKGFKKRAHRLYEALKISLKHRKQQHVVDFLVFLDFNRYYDKQSELLKSRSRIRDS